MKTYALAFALMGFACLLPAVAEELLPDGGFEDVTQAGGLRGWRVNASAGYPFETVEVIRGDPRYVRSGDSSVKLVQMGTDEGGKGKFGHLYSNASVPVKTGQRYILSFWAKGKGEVRAWVYNYKLVEGSEGYHLGQDLLVTNREESEGNAGAYFLEDENQWKQCRFTCPVNEAVVVAIRPAIVVHGTIYVDDVTLEETTEKIP